MPQPQIRRPTGKKGKAAAKTNLKRFGLVVALFVFWGAAIGARLVYLQTAQHQFFLAKAVEQRQRERKTKPLRGSILDREGRELAITLEVESLWIDPTEIENAEAVSFRLAHLIGEKPKTLLSTINDAKQANRRFMWLARELDKEAAQKIREADVPALRWQKEQKRFYPHGKLAAQVVGFASRDDVGQAGIEMTQDKILRGEPNEILEELDGKRRVLEATELNAGKTPRNIALTLDYAIQYRVEQALAAGVQAARAKGGTAVVLNPKNGEILAMASAPTFDPNAPGEVSPELLQNRAVQTVFEPGSTFKLITYAAALESGAASLSDTINASAGYIKIGERRISDSHAVSKPLSLNEAFARSSNVAAVTIGQKIGKERFHEFVKRFGYGSQTGVELPAETRGRVYSPEKWTADSVASVSIGYEISVTSLQSAAAYAAIANDGVRVQPHLIKEIREENGDVVYQAKPESLRVVSAETADAMRQMLKTVTEEGTGKKAQIEGYSSAGKTGTARKYDPEKRRYASGKYVGSFVGFAPADNPAVVIAVMVDEPSGSYYGGEVAAPIFRDIAEQVLPELNIAPAFGDDILLAKSGRPELNPEKISLPLKVENNADDKSIDAKQTHEKSSAVGNQKTSEKTTPKNETADKNEKVKIEKAVKTEKPQPNEPRPRIVEEKTAAKPKTQTATQNKAKNETAPKKAASEKPKKT
ncbi:MAG: penicillin-binding transpeptidase domain-containing protein [Acidobacteriota bacterium]|nr:penicillin-binding transpeptidase domain-containing protein [Acidobacteriota bacterium]